MSHPLNLCAYMPSLTFSLSYISSTPKILLSVFTCQPLNKRQSLNLHRNYVTITEVNDDRRKDKLKLYLLHYNLASHDAYVLH